MAKEKIEGYIKAETVIWFVIAALFVGFIAGVVFGVYKSASMTGVGQAPPPVAMDTAARKDIDALKARVGENPGDRDAWIQLGHRYFDMQRFDEAIDAYEKALDIDDKDANVWTDLGVMYRRAGNPQKAIESFDHAMAINPSHEVSRFNKGVVLFHDLEDKQGAQKTWEALLAINPEAKSPDGMPVRELVDHLKKESRDSK